MYFIFIKLSKFELTIESIWKQSSFSSLIKFGFNLFSVEVMILLLLLTFFKYELIISIVSLFSK